MAKPGSEVHVSVYLDDAHRGQHLHLAFDGDSSYLKRRYLLTRPPTEDVERGWKFASVADAPTLQGDVSSVYGLYKLPSGKGQHQRESSFVFYEGRLGNPPAPSADLLSLVTRACRSQSCVPSLSPGPYTYVVSYDRTKALNLAKTKEIFKVSGGTQSFDPISWYVDLTSRGDLDKTMAFMGPPSLADHFLQAGSLVSSRIQPKRSLPALKAGDVIEARRWEASSKCYHVIHPRNAQLYPEDEESIGAALAPCSESPHDEGDTGPPPPYATRQRRRTAHETADSGKVMAVEGNMHLGEMGREPSVPEDVHDEDKSMATSCMSAEQGTIPATAGAVGCKTQRVEVLEKRVANLELELLKSHERLLALEASCPYTREEVDILVTTAAEAAHTRAKELVDQSLRGIGTVLEDRDVVINNYIQELRPSNAVEPLENSSISQHEQVLDNTAEQPPISAALKGAAHNWTQADARCLPHVPSEGPGKLGSCGMCRIKARLKTCACGSALTYCFQCMCVHMQAPDQESLMAMSEQSIEKVEDRRAFVKAQLAKCTHEPVVTTRVQTTCSVCCSGRSALIMYCKCRHRVLMHEKCFAKHVAASINKGS